MSTSLRIVVQRAIVFGLLLVAPARAQETALPHVPFRVGERLEYDLKFGKLKVGVASMEVANVEDVRGHDAWHTVYQAHGGLRFLYSVDDVFESWIDRRTFNSLRFKKDQNEGRRDVEHTYEIYPERGVFTVGDDSARASVHSPLDDGSFLYFVRTIPLVVGQTYTFERYFMPERNPVTIRVIRKDTIDVPAGRFSAIVIQPIFKTSGIFSENGHAEVWLSDDKNRIMLQVKSSLSFGSINLYLTSYRPYPAAPAAQTP
ncbi:MAG: DUF3108 domain-containing protein [Gemmatimonadota bacterium]|nr:DUF3108 domain-containing protein [Gemmatimonadota bacterium]